MEIVCGGVSEIKGSENDIKIVDLARFAVDEHNKKENSLLQFVRVVSAKQHVVSGMSYYLTIEATDGGTKKVYEASIWVKSWMDFKAVQGFKLLGDS